MPEPLTAEELRTLRELEAKATPGPYEAVPVVSERIGNDISHSASEWYILNGPPQVIENYMFSKRAFRVKEDAMLLAAARNALPKLLDEIDRLQAENERLKDQLEDGCPYCEGMI